MQFAAYYLNMTKNYKATDKLKVVMYDLPAYWASYLINGDTSESFPEANKFLDKNGLPSPVSCSNEAWFSWNNDANTGLGGDVLTYTFLI